MWVAGVCIGFSADRFERLAHRRRRDRINKGCVGDQRAMACHPQSPAARRTTGWLPSATSGVARKDRAPLKWRKRKIPAGQADAAAGSIGHRDHLAQQEGLGGWQSREKERAMVLHDPAEQAPLRGFAEIRRNGSSALGGRDPIAKALL